MKQLVLGANLSLLALTLMASPSQAQNDDKGWVQLFNGKDKEGWKVHPDEPGDWSVKDGILIGRGAKRSHIYTVRGDYENFHYRIEAKISDKGNSGQYFRTEFPAKASYPKGYEAQINSTHPDPQKTGSLYGFSKVTDMLVAPDTWFTQEVIAKGNHIIILVNGKKVVDFVDTKNTYKKGHFAIQQHPPAKGSAESIIMIKKVEVKELPAEPKKGAKAEESRLKEEQIQILEKMIAEFEKVKNPETLKMARAACRNLEVAFLKLSEEFNALPEKEKDEARLAFEAREIEVFARLREAKAKAVKTLSK